MSLLELESAEGPSQRPTNPRLKDLSPGAPPTGADEVWRRGGPQESADGADLNLRLQAMECVCPAHCRCFEALEGRV